MYPVQFMIKTGFLSACLLIISISFSVSNGQERYYERNLLTSRYDRADIDAGLINDSTWVPYPHYRDRAAWEALPQHQRKRFIRQGEAFLDHVWVSVPVTSYIEYGRTGNRAQQERYQLEISNALWSLFMAEMVEGKGRFMDQIMNGVWAMSEMSSWSMAAHLGIGQLPDTQNPHIDLRAASYAQLLSWIHYFLEDEFDAVNEQIAERIRYEVQRRVLEPYYERTDFWWMGFEGSRMHRLNNWNPHCNGSILVAILLMEKDHQRKINGIYKLMQSLENFVNCYPEDGACDEGPSYWIMAAGANFETLHMLYMATNGQVDVFDDPLIKKMGKYIYHMNISYPYFYNYSDGSPKPEPTAYVVYKYGERIDDQAMMGFGAFLAEKQNFGMTSFRGTPFIVFESLFDQDNILSYPPHQPMLKDVWFSELQIVSARDLEGSDRGFYFAAKGGHNAPWNHNHNDVGSFILYYDGQPVVIDVGVKTYTAQTFGAGRYDIWTMQSAYHNLPVINGVMQKEGRQYEAANVQYYPHSDSVRFSLDIAGAYPEEAKVEQWIRSYIFRRGQSLEIREKYRLASLEKPWYHTFMTLPEPVEIAPGTIRFTLSSGNSIKMQYDPEAFSVTIEEMEITDVSLKNSWGERLYRVLLQSRSTGKNGVSGIVFSR